MSEVKNPNLGQNTRRIGPTRHWLSSRERKEGTERKKQDKKQKNNQAGLLFLYSIINAVNGNWAQVLFFI